MFMITVPGTLHFVDGNASVGFNPVIKKYAAQVPDNDGTTVYTREDNKWEPQNNPRAEMAAQNANRTMLGKSIGETVETAALT